MPDCKIILGGFTATHFADEIIEKFDPVDIVVRGDAEVPLLEIAEGKELKEIPNIVWRKENRIFVNPQTYRLGKDMLDRLSFTEFSAVRHFEEYKRLGIPKDDRENKWLFVYNPGIGCPVNCSYCGGSRSSQKRLNTREQHVFISPAKAITELKSLAENSMGVWYVCFDPDTEKEYYLEIFRMIREEGLRMRCKFESWSLPAKEFVDAFSRTFEKGSEILLSPDAGSEKVRKINKGFFYSNEQLFDSVRYMGEKGVLCRLYFTAGLPGESMGDFVETLVMINKFRTEFSNAAINAVPIEIEPAAPMFFENKKYKIVSKRKSINDFYEAHKKQSGIGYSTEHFKEEEIPELVNLARATAGCVMKRPVFVKALSEKKIPAHMIPAAEMWRLCAICKFCGRCFG
jgi:radical SAM superfamily enzyme YgiQ (UPF0313 family)